MTKPLQNNSTQKDCKKILNFVQAFYNKSKKLLGGMEPKKPTWNLEHAEISLKVSSCRERNEKKSLGKTLRKMKAILMEVTLISIKLHQFLEKVNDGRFPREFVEAKECKNFNFPFQRNVFDQLKCKNT